MIEPPPYKLMMFLKRKPGTTVAAFRDHYENRHVPLCRKYMPGVLRYVRHYVDVLPDPVTGVPPEMEFDVVTELWLPDREAYDALAAAFARGIMPPDVIEDEERFLDRSKSRTAFLIESETDLATPA